MYTVYGTYRIPTVDKTGFTDYFHFSVQNTSFKKKIFPLLFFGAQNCGPPAFLGVSLSYDAGLFFGWSRSRSLGCEASDEQILSRDSEPEGFQKT